MNSDFKRVAVLGLDGVPFSLLERLCDQGIMPNLETLRKTARFSPITASLPEISSVSWTSFMTGANPGEHGVYGFMDFAPGTYQFRFPSFNDIKVPTIWDELGGNGLSSIVINQPSTYPAKPINGALVSGFVAVDLAKAVHPSELYGELQQIGYRVDMDLRRARNDPDYLFESLGEELRLRKQVTELLCGRMDWSLLSLVITGTDRLHHFHITAANEDDPQNQRFMDYYRQVDDLIGWYHELVSARPGSDTLFVMLSDHGFTALRSEVNVNAVLASNGLLNYASDSPRSIQEIGEGTQAFCLDPSRIYLNCQGRYPLGTVTPEQEKPLLEKIKALFTGLKHQGEPVIDAVYDKHDLFQGPHLNKAPDIVLRSKPGFDLKASVAAPEVFTFSGLKGMHTWNDAFCLVSDPGFHPESVFDFKAMILKHLEIKPEHKAAS